MPCRLAQVWVWHGESASEHEKQKASEVAELLRLGEDGSRERSASGSSVRLGQAFGSQEQGAAAPTAAPEPGERRLRPVRVLAEGTAEGDGGELQYRYQSCQHPFWRHLPGERKPLGVSVGDDLVEPAAKDGSDEQNLFKPVLVYASAKESRGRGQGSGVQLKRVWQGEKPPISKLQSERVVLFDMGAECVIWCGRLAPKQDRASAFPFAQAYLKQYRRPAMLPITRFQEGLAPEWFLEHFGPPSAAAAGCCIIS